MNRNVPLKRVPFAPRSVPLQRTGWERNTASRGAGFSPVGKPVSGSRTKTAATRKPLRPVSLKRQRENRQRAAMADRRWPDRREGTVMCEIPGCTRRAVDVGEILPRGRGGSIVDDENTMAQCREHNEELTKSPAWAYKAGVLKHDGVCCQGRRVCSRYEQKGAA